MATYLKKITDIISRIPGMGQKSTKRFVLHLIKNKQDLIPQLINELQRLSRYMHNCNICGNLSYENTCEICTNISRDKSIICVVEDIVDLWGFEKSSIYNGTYHILGGKLSAMNNVRPEDLYIQKLLDRLKSNSIKEIIIATNPTLDGRTTGYYLANLLSKHISSDTKLSCLGYGMPIGAEIDYMDSNTLEFALNERKPFVLDKEKI